MIAAGPAIVNGNRTNTQLINTPDIFATIAELCGFANWKSMIPSTTKIDSRSFLPILKNQTAAIRTWIFTEQFTNIPAASDGKTIRNEDYHLLRFDNGTEAFYNQTIDPEENTNLLLNTMTPQEIMQYHFLCDSITALVGAGSCQPLQITNEIKKADIQIFPNPANDMVNIDSDIKITEVSMYDLAGRLVKKYNTTNMHVSDIKSGTYLLNICCEDGRICYKKIDVLH